MTPDSPTPSDHEPELDPSAPDPHADAPPPGSEEAEEWVPADDAVIGRAFRRSMVVIAAVAVLVVLAVFLLRRTAQPGEERTMETTAPEPVRFDEVDPPELPFTDVTAAAGIDFVHENGAAGEKLLPETMGSGVLFADLDGDGDPDLLFQNGRTWPHDLGPGESPTATPRLYRNDGVGDGGGEGGVPRFVDVTAGSGLDEPIYGTGLATGDVDGDGDLDLFLAAVGPNRLLLNEGDLRFRDVTTAAAVAGDDDEWSTSTTFFDADGDGDLDLFVGNYVRWSRQIDTEVDYRLTGVGRAYGPPVNYQGAQSYLYRNEGLEGGVPRFTDVSAEAGIEVVNEATGVPVGKALGVAPADLEGDGDLDLLVANDTVQNFLFENLTAQGRPGQFQEKGEIYGLAYGRAGEATGAMGIDAGHYRNDRALGFAIGNFANEMTSLYVSQGEATVFADEAIVDGVGAPSRTLLTFGTLFLDLDLDGRLDLLQTNGHLENDIGTVDPSQSYEQPSQLFWNAGPGSARTFVEVPVETTGDLARPLVGRSSATADMDGDGDLDVVLTQAGRPALLLRNDQDLGHRWVRLELRDPGSADPFALGAVGILATTDEEGGGQGDVVQTRTVMPSRSYQSQSELVLTFGLGDAEAIGSLEIAWPGQPWSDEAGDAALQDAVLQAVDPDTVEIGATTRIVREAEPEPEPGD